MVDERIFFLLKSIAPCSASWWFNYESSGPQSFEKKIISFVVLPCHPDILFWLSCAYRRVRATVQHPWQNSWFYEHTDALALKEVVESCRDQHSKQSRLGYTVWWPWPWRLLICWNRSMSRHSSIYLTSFITSNFQHNPMKFTNSSFTHACSSSTHEVPTARHLWSKAD